MGERALLALQSGQGAFQGDKLSVQAGPFGFKKLVEAVDPAIERGEREAKQDRVDLVTHGRDGKIRSKDSFAISIGA